MSLRNKGLTKVIKTAWQVESKTEVTLEHINRATANIIDGGGRRRQVPLHLLMDANGRRLDTLDLSGPPPQAEVEREFKEAFKRSFKGESGRFSPRHG